MRLCQNFKGVRMEYKNEPMDLNLQIPAAKSPAPPPVTPPSSQILRQWRPAAQRNLKNQWLKLVSLWNDWLSSSYTAHSHASSLVNSYLSQRYMEAMEFGVLSDMPELQKKACHKLHKQQVINRGQLLLTYKSMVCTQNMVGIVTQMVKASRSMRCYVKGMGNSPNVQFSCNPAADDYHQIDNGGDGGGVPVFSFLSISSFEQLAEELVQMLKSEMNLKRLLVMEFCSIGDKEDSIHWSEELYLGEFGDLIICDLYSNEPIFLGQRNCKSSIPSNSPRDQAESNVLQVYTTTWLEEVKLDRFRINEIFSIVGEELHVTLS
ncbi:unnamed protein product [Cuscuta epithymum]|uniref:Uncharacterized protein n=1 Tax=Cuscuta epithymum TaxID=186058 RepID=A0AAV0FXG0_9ASTE|nr:unnamed protein product [Cuscuta epithymum]